MGYAIKQDGTGMRAVDSAEDCGNDEDYSDSPTPPPPSIVSLKVMKRSEIDAAWLAANNGTFLFAGAQIQADAIGSKNISQVGIYVALNSALPPGFPGYWKAADNSQVPMTDVATFKAMHAAMVAAGITNFGKAQQLKAAVGAATTAEQIDAIAW